MEELNDNEKQIVARLLSRAAKFKPFFQRDINRIAGKLDVSRYYQKFMHEAETGQNPLDLDAPKNFEPEPQKRKQRDLL